MSVTVIAGYLEAKRLVIEAGYIADVTWAESLADIKPTPLYVLREFSWVVVNSGFRYAVARKLWPGLLDAFLGFEPSMVSRECLPAARRILNHAGKLDAICMVADEIRTQGIRQIVDDAREPEKLTRLPWIGNTTCWHLAKVLGHDVVKPDVHLQRAAQAARYATPRALCEAIRDALGESVTVVDSVLWRFGEQRAAQGWPTWDELWFSDLARGARHE